MRCFDSGVFLVGFKTMLLLFETPAGFAIFKVLDEGKLSKVEVNFAAYVKTLNIHICAHHHV